LSIICENNRNPAPADAMLISERLNLMKVSTVHVHEKLLDKLVHNRNMGRVSR
jgi:hypothetical protein